MVAAGGGGGKLLIPSLYPHIFTYKLNPMPPKSPDWTVKVIVTVFLVTSLGDPYTSCPHLYLIPSGSTLLQGQKPSLDSLDSRRQVTSTTRGCSASQTNQWQSSRLRGLAQSHPSLSFTRACLAANGKGDDVKQPICRFLTLFTNCCSE